MKPSSRSASSATQQKSIRDRVSHWLLLRADRRVVAVGMTAVVIAVFAALIASETVAVGPTSSAASLFGSGLTSGVVTLVTIALSINQLVISRVFDPINNLSDRLQGSRDLRETVEEIADQPSTPNDPATFLSLIATTISEAASKLQELATSKDWEPSAEATAVVDDLLAYGESIDENIERDTRVSNILGVIIGPEYAYNMTAVSHLRQSQAETMPAAADAELEIIEESLESIAVVRQFYKTIALQQDFAALSRQLVYTGVIALLCTMSLTLVYQTSAVTLPMSVLPVVITLGIGVIFLPLGLFVAYVLRAATIAGKTVSVGPFIPPKAR